MGLKTYLLVLGNGILLGWLYQDELNAGAKHLANNIDKLISKAQRAYRGMQPVKEA